MSKMMVARHRVRRKLGSNHFIYRLLLWLSPLFPASFLDSLPMTARLLKQGQNKLHKQAVRGRKLKN